jgi:nicotinamide-nucleotide amidase
MRVEIVAIANEILNGYTVNSNASFLSLELRKEGYKVARHTVAADSETDIEECLREALERSTVVITTGGLGPTLDDLTKRVLAKVFSSKLIFHVEVAEELKRKYGNEYEALKELATVPDKAFILKNDLGSAPGFIFFSEEKMVISLPGVPREMKEMFQFRALPYLKEHLPLDEKMYTQEMHFGILPERSVDKVLEGQKKEGLSFGIYPSLGILHVTISAFAKSAQEAYLKTDLVKKNLAEKFADHLFDAESGLIEEALHRDFTQAKKLLAIAESCTGGAIAKKITSFAGASDYFLGSVVSYSDDLKRDFLAVSKETLEEGGAVSVQAVEEMVEGLFAKTSCDYALAVSGIAGPTGGSVEKPVGTVFVALARRGEPILTGKLMAKGRNRAGIIEYAANFCLFSLWMYLTQGKTPLFQRQ